ncbi:signal peptide peptidase SppA [Candidatus Woesearchaeota archaeon]|nr:signal peptide peptidase SppA [Candidatus Woesearchaeota archaeon]
MKPKNSTWGNVIKIILLFFLLSLIASFVISFFTSSEPRGNVAVINIKGMITADRISSFNQITASSTDITELIEKADSSPSIEAILLEINSPGGSAVASKEIADAIGRAEKPTYALIRETGASGAYWAASSADSSIASPLSITGSIGVFSSYIEFAGLLKRYNMSYNRLVSGKYKDIGDPFKDLTEKEEEILQLKLDKIHEYFIKEVAENRNLSLDYTRNLATGEFYLGTEALAYGLIDKLGDKKTAEEMIKQDLGLEMVEFAEYSRPKTFADILGSLVSRHAFMVGEGMGLALNKESHSSFEINI